MDVSLVIRQRLEEFGLEQRDLARAAQVTESYISQLLTRRKSPPAPNRTDIYDKMDKFLRLPKGEMARLATAQRREGLKRELGESSALFGEVRDLVLRKCHPDTAPHVRAIFHQQPFGELERLVTGKLLYVVKRVAKQELENEYWLRMVADLGGHSYQEMRVIVLEFLDTDIFNLSREHCVTFLDPMIESWNMDLTTFALDIVLNPRAVSGNVRRFEFVEKDAEAALVEQPGLAEFLKDPALSAGVTADELTFLKRLRFKEKAPTALYYYRELQNLRDPLHFHTASPPIG
ncbi:MAG TPA: helix-turn-helix transcriptional regulator [Gemmatimonadales bacterium]|nr:helix-turn-helix transcriptional regulator [Gemmatimonadales bacterium]